MCGCEAHQNVQREKQQKTEEINHLKNPINVKPHNEHLENLGIPFLPVGDHNKRSYSGFP